MSAMADLDIKLSEYKLSDAQKNAVLDVLDQGWTSAKANTIKSLENKGILVKVSETHHNFTDEFVRESGIFGEQPEGLDREKVAQIQALEDSLGGEAGDAGDPSKPAKLGLTDAHGMADWELELLDITREQAERFDSSLGVYYNNLLGFGEVYKWNNIKVWDGLTADEIRKDMNTAVPINRAARRKGAKLTRKFIKALSKVS